MRDKWSRGKGSETKVEGFWKESAGLKIKNRRLMGKREKENSRQSWP
jgi:hypothetical protein